MEQLNRVVSSGEIERLYGGAGGSVGAPSEVRVRQTMEAEGMEGAGAVHGASFSDLLKDSVEKVNTMQVQADTAIKDLTAGRTKNIHETMLTIERADASLKLMMQVRNKILDAYREIMRMQV